MQCKSCEYPLWNLKARQCPECGEPFKPSEFEFKPNSVCFCCPNCEQTYYGTALTGHLDPESFVCVTCNKPIHMDEMILRPTEGVQEQDTRADYNPWLERQRDGRLKSWMKTVGRAMVAPGRLMRSTPAETSTGQAWWFAIATSLMMMVGGVLLVVPFLLFVLYAAGQGGGGPNASVILMSTGIGLGTSLVFIFLFVTIVIGIWGAVTHGLLSLTGHVEHGIGRTYQAMCYSSGANITSALICCGGHYWGWVWWAVSAVLMVKEGQKTSGLRASFAVLTLPVIFVVGVMTLYGIMVGVAINQASSAQGILAATGTGVFDTTTVVESMHAYADDHQGLGAGHGLQLVTDGNLNAMNLVPWSGGMISSDPLFPESESVFLDFFNSSPPTQRNIAEAAAASLPEGVIAHRAGDFVFINHDDELEVLPPHLWIVILAPFNLSPTDNTLPGYYVVGLADGSTVEFPIEEMTLFRLVEQNIFRADVGLSPLPDPMTVTTTQPALESP